MEFTILYDGREELRELTDDLRAPVDRPLLGWVRKPHGWCRGDACIPGRAVDEEGGVDVVAFARLAGLVTAVDRDERVIAFAEAPVRESGIAPAFTLDGWSLDQALGRKVALVFWASWCGCRYDLKAWEERHRELESHGFTIVSVACDRDPEDARPWQDGFTHPALIDVDGVVAERYDVVNVPTVVWIDEEGRIARPQDTQTATDLFRSMNGIDSERSHQALRRWVIDGETGSAPLRTASPDGQIARAHARIAVWLARHDRLDAARGHLDTAGELAPHDLTIRRGLMPITGTDPFGDAYFELRDELDKRGIPIYRPLEAG